MDIADSVAVATGGAVVTGGASGPGLATARKPAEAGAHVVLLDLPRTDADDGEVIRLDGAIRMARR